MIQLLMYDRVGVFDHVCSIAQVLQHVGLSLHKAGLVSAHRAAANRQAWRTTPWPHILRGATARQTLLLCGDDASFPPWGTRTSPGARRGQQPHVKTSGTRKGAKVFGCIAYCTGQFFYQGQEECLNATASMTFLRRVLAQTSPPILLMQDGARYHARAETTACFAQQAARLQVL